MRHHLIAERYAKALSSAIDSAEELEEALDALRDFAEVYEGHPELRQAIENPVLTLDVRKAVLEEVVKRSGMPEIACGFIRTLFLRGRISLLADVLELLDRVVNKRLGRVRAEVTTAVPLTESHTEKIRKSLSDFARKEVHLTTEVDASIIGGVVVRMEGTVFDGSLRARLARMKLALMAEETG